MSKSDGSSISTPAFILFSGGNDSLVLLHWAIRNIEFDAVVHLDTGIGVPESQQFVRETCKAWGVKLLIYSAKENTKADGTLDPMVYDDLVLEHGFPGPSAHFIMFSKLKQRSLERLKRDYAPRSEIVYITGVRQDESARRKISVKGEYDKRGRTIWRNPLWDWTNESMDSYRRENELPTNPVSAKLGLSGECLCGAYAKPGELDRIAKHYPEVAQRIKALERRFTEQCALVGMPSWGWEGKPPRWWNEHKKGQGTLFAEQMICSGCSIRNTRGGNEV